MFTTIIFILVISILVFVHEFGHFVMAKRAGMKVEEFGFGFPPRLLGIKRGETVYSINWIPFGGFVKIYGEDGDDRDKARSFGSKPFWPRMGVILAGVVMNFLFAALLLIAGNFLGLRIGLIESKDIQEAADKKVQIIQVVQDSPAQKADLRLLDEIKSFNMNGVSQIVHNVQEVQTYTAAHQGQAVHIVVSRSGQDLDKEVLLRGTSQADQGYLGISLALTGVIKYPWYTSLWKGIYDAVILTINTVMGYFLLFKTLFVKHKLLADVSGPIGIATLTGQAAHIGINYLIQFIAMISVNLAVLNVIPFPALDGGRAAMLLIEKAKGSPINKQAEGMINAVGFFILLGLMLLVTARDLKHFF